MIHNRAMIGGNLIVTNGDVDIAHRRRKALYRANHRGTKEMDWLLGRFADSHVAAFDGADLTVFEGLIALPDPDLHHWIFYGEVETPQFTVMVARIRAYHGLTDLPLAD